MIINVCDMIVGFMKSTVLWVTAMWSSKSFPIFWKNCCLHWKGKWRQKAHSKYWQWAGRYCFRSQKTVIFLVTTAETSNLTSTLWVLVGTPCKLCHHQYQHDDSKNLWGWNKRRTIQHTVSKCIKADTLKSCQ